jgi:hypothetical protein
MSKTSKTTQENKPPAWAQPLFQTSATDAMNLYKSGVGGNTYTGSTVAPLSDTTMGGINQLAQAGQGWNTAGTRPLYQGLGAAAVSNPYQSQLGTLAGQIDPQNVGTRLYWVANQNVSGIANGRNGIRTESDYRKVLGQARGPSSAQNYLTDYASGKYLDPAANPYFSKALQDQLDNTAATVQSQFSGMGRYGSGANTGELTRQLGQLSTQAMADQFAREQANQFNAVNQLDAARNAGIGNQLAAVSGITGVEGQNIANRLAGAELQANIADSISGILSGNADRQLAGQGLQGNMLANAGQMYSTGIGQAQNAADAMSNLDQRNFQNQLQGAGATLQAGGLLDQQAQKLLSDEVAKWYSLDNQDWTRLGMLQTAATGAAGPYGTQVATSRQPVGIGSILSGFGSLIHK